MIHESNALILQSLPLVFDRWMVRFSVEGEALTHEEVIDPHGVFPVFMAVSLHIEQMLGTDFLRPLYFAKDDQALLGWSVDLSAPTNPIMFGLMLMQGAHRMMAAPEAVRKDGVHHVVDVSKVVGQMDLLSIMEWQNQRKTDTTMSHEGLTSG